MPITSIDASFDAFAYRAGADSKSTPNLFSLSPVEI
jgi:hypothetical protein